MVDTARQLLDELMGRNRNLDPTAAKSKKVQWDDPEVFLITNIIQLVKTSIAMIYFRFHFSFVCIIW